MAVLNTTGSWEVGDDLRLLEALDLSNQYGYLDQLILCMNQLTLENDPIVIRVRALLDRYEVAESTKQASDLQAPEGKVLVKADILEWEVGQSPNSISSEIQSAKVKLANYFGFCAYVPPATHYTGGEYLPLYHS